VEPHLNIGGALLRLGRPAEALTAFDRALSVAPVNGEARYGHAVASLVLGDRATALADREILVKLDPSRAERLTRSISQAEQRE
jgi:Flp pilus assembly protein TadD